MHGVVDLATDAEAIVLDPSFRGSDVEALIGRLAERSASSLDWHPATGSRPRPSRCVSRAGDPAVRAAIGARFGDGWLDARIIGVAAADIVHDPCAWHRWGTPDDLLQHLKKVWHAVVAFGRPVTAPDDRVHLKI